MAKIAEQVEAKFKQALKNKDTKTTSVLRLAKNALVNERIAKMHDLSDEEEMTVIRREVKKRQESADIYAQAGQSERAAAEKDEADYLKQFLPAEMSEGDIRALVQKAITATQAGPGDFGKVMGAVMKELAGRASGDRVSQIVREELAK